MPQIGLVSESIISDRENIPRMIAFNKPYGVLPCFTDSDGRQTLADYIDLPGVYAAERLGLEGQGLMIMTSDGSLAYRITDPQHKLPKVYLVRVERIPNEEVLRQLRTAMVLSGKRTRLAEAGLTQRSRSCWTVPLPVSLQQGRGLGWMSNASLEI